MEKVTISFITEPLQNCIEVTKHNDMSCFPEEMWLTEEEWQVLLAGNAESTLLFRNHEIIRQAITLPESFVADSLQVVDPAFQPKPAGVYSYSEAILPQYQHKGYGKLLIDEIAIRMRERGFTSISAHVRTRHGWHIRRKKKLLVTSARSIPNFWTDPRDSLVEFQSASLFPKTALI